MGARGDGARGGRGVREARGRLPAAVGRLSPGAG
ncbi:hypothetical protein SFR_6725 [Streptomyces sp. FR-008]|nr:hypothetical protein SFR_6725 [Streptomyces sp. FR-008]